MGGGGGVVRPGGGALAGGEGAGSEQVDSEQDQHTQAGGRQRQQGSEGQDVQGTLALKSQNEKPGKSVKVDSETSPLIVTGNHITL